MSNVTTVSIFKLGDDPVCAGRVDGRRTMVRTLESLERHGPLVVLDFAGVDLATSSFLSEAVLRLRDHLRLGSPPASLVVSNLAEAVEEELGDLLTRSRQAMFAADQLGEQLTNTRLLGQLDEKLDETLRLVVARGDATASELHADTADDTPIGPTAWNNRLNSLADMSLLVESARGRTKRYRPVLEL
jgi:hypothetical protein